MNTHLTLRHSFRPLLVLVVALSRCEARSTTLVFGTNQAVNFSLNVPTNQAVVIYGGRMTPMQPETYWRITQFGKLHLFQTGMMSDPIVTTEAGHPNILAGPLVLELFITNTASYGGSWISYEVVPLAGLQTLIVPGGTTNTVDVAAGTNFRMLSRSSDSAMMESWTLVSGTARAAVIETANSDSEKLILDMEFRGPVGFEIGNNDPSYPRWVTYSLHSGSVQTLPGGVIATTGANALTVEESADLVNWSASAVMLKDAAPSKFYRLKVSR